MNKGFTLIELLIVIFLLIVLYSLISPFSYSLYLSYRETQELEKTIFQLNQYRRQAFLTNQELVLFEKDNQLLINNESLNSTVFKFKMDKPIIFFKNSSSTGGIIFVYSQNSFYEIRISSPLGVVTYERVSSFRSY